MAEQCNLAGENVTFPDPAYIRNAEWEIRYGNPTREQLLVAASALAIYRDLLTGASSREKLSRMRRVTRAAKEGS